MSEENVETVREIYRKLTRGDLDGALEHAVDDAEHDWSRSVGPYRGVYHGRDEVRGLWSAFTEAAENLVFEVEEAIDAEPHVVALVRVRIRGRGSGVETVGRGPHVWTFRDGKVIRFRLFQEEHEALAAVGATS